MAYLRLQRRFIALGALALLGATTSVARASDLDPATGELVSTVPGAIMIGFDSAATMTQRGVALTKWAKGSTGFSSTLAYVDSGGTPITAAELQAHLAPDRPVQGKQALLLGYGPTDGATGVLVPFSTLASSFTTPQIQITVWARTMGATPTLAVTYGKAALPDPGAFSVVTAIRTGRETNDGWSEFSTGPIDTQVWGVPLDQISVSLGSSDLRRDAKATLAIDGLEIAPVAGTTSLPATACTMVTQETACGEDGECHYGHCLPGYATWGPTPTQDYRSDFVDRWITLAKNIQGARNATQNAAAMVAARPTLTAATVGGRQFYAGMMGLVNGLRNQHTSFGSPPNQGLLQPIADGGTSATVGACLGFGELDLLETPPAQTLGFIVYSLAPASAIGAKLSPGDAITKIDGIDPLTWVRSVYLTYASSVPADPGADLAWSATSVAFMISHRASTMEVTHCASSTNCTGENVTVTEVDVAGPSWASVQGTGVAADENTANLLDCVERFQNTVTPPTTTGTGPGAGGGGEKVLTGAVNGNILGVQFDGTDVDFTVWESMVTPAFSAAPLPSMVLFDVRQGNGGYAEDSELIAEEIRPATQPVGEVGFAVAAWDGSATEASLLASVPTGANSCEDESVATTQSAPCAYILDDYFIGDYYEQAGFEESEISPSTPLQPFTPGGIAARVAWLQAADVSANDYLAALIQGRLNQRVFAPGPTSGSYGTISSTSVLLTGWRAGSIQVTDSIWGSSVADWATQPFRSGTGVAPDQIVAQKMSDTMNGIDTMITVAQNWLEDGVTVGTGSGSGSDRHPTRAQATRTGSTIR